MSRQTCSKNYEIECVRMWDCLWRTTWRTKPAETFFQYLLRSAEKKKDLEQYENYFWNSYLSRIQSTTQHRTFQHHPLVHNHQNSNHLHLLTVISSPLRTHSAPHSSSSLVDLCYRSTRWTSGLPAPVFKPVIILSRTFPWEERRFWSPTTS